MIYPKFLESGNVVGICAPSSGIGKEDFPEFDRSLLHLRCEGYEIKETASVRSGLDESAPPDIRGAELNRLLHDGDTRAIICASGGDFLISMLPYVDFDALRADPKWIQGYSDPTSLLYSITTKHDVATIYGVNAGGFWMDRLHSSLSDGLRILKGDIPTQHSFSLYERDRSGRDGGYNLEHKVKWETPFGDFKATGRLIGGCMDCLCDVIGTRFDGTPEFLDRYSGDGVIWYFDIFAMKSEAVHNTLFKMKDMGYFRGATGFIFGRVCFPSSFTGMSYAEAAIKVLGDAPMAFEADVGHVPPKMTIINGAIGELECIDGRASLKTFLA
jgi:muramoyltetrapeptide carboxypeptidase LdcA involved in peptidoglycan recycling